MYLVTIPLYKGKSHEIGETLTNHVFCKDGPQSYLIFNEDQAFLSSVMQYVYKRIDIKIKTINPYNCGSLKTERHI